ALYAGLAGVRVCHTRDPKRLAEVALGRPDPATTAPVARPPDPFQLLAAAGRLGAVTRPAVPLSRGELLGQGAAGPSRRRELEAHRPVPVGRLFDRLAQLRRPTPGDALGRAVLA